jgi:acetate---CoA ligase (ADP-forming)
MSARLEGLRRIAMNEDQTATLAAHRLDRLFSAESLVIVGASRDPTRIGGRPLTYLKAHGYRGRLYVVNPNLDEIDGVPSFKDVRDLPEPVDLALISMPARQCPDVVAGCVERGIGAIVVFSGGFSEVGSEGARYEHEIVETARRAGIPLLGPNCVGFVNMAERLPASFATPLEQAPAERNGDVAFVTGSGFMGTFMYDMAQHGGLPVGYFVSVGNEAALSMGTISQYLVERPNVKAIGLHVEGLHDGPSLLDAVAAAHDAGKAICIFKTGRSEAGQRAALSHTGALAGSPSVFTDVMTQHGAVVVDAPQDMLDFLRVCHDYDGQPAGNRVGVVSISGGMGTWLADLLADFGIDLMPFSDATGAEIRAALPEFASASNPSDMTGQVVHRPEIIPAVVGALIEDPEIDTIIVVVAYQPVNGAKIATYLIDLNRRARERGKLLAIEWIYPLPEHLDMLRPEGVVAFSDPGRCARAVGRYLAWSAALSNVEERPAADEGTLGRVDPVSEDEAGLVVCTEAESKEFIRGLGFATPAGGTATSVAEALVLGEKLGYPVVLKGQARGISHKAAYGLVELGVSDPASLARRFEELKARLADVDPGGTVLVERHLAAAGEMILGAHRDPQFGTLVMFGSGGEGAEEQRDVHFLAGRIGAKAARGLVARTKWGARIGRTAGGAEKMSAMAEAIVRISQIIDANSEWLESIEMNPVVFEGDSLVALDALIVQSPRTEKA